MSTPRFIRRFSPCLVAGALLAAGAPGIGAAQAREGPSEVVSGTVETLLQAVTGCRFHLATDSGALRELADGRVRPALDVLFAGQVILGRWWSEASAAQRRTFAEALYGSLANRYAPSLLLMTGNTVRMLRAQPPGEGLGEAVVPIEVSVPGYPPVRVDLQMRHSAGRWRVYDARFEDLSPVLKMREEFSAEIRREGLEAVIARLERSAAAPGVPGGQARRCLNRQTGS